MQFISIYYPSLYLSAEVICHLTCDHTTFSYSRKKDQDDESTCLALPGYSYLVMSLW